MRNLAPIALAFALTVSACAGTVGAEPTGVSTGSTTGSGTADDDGAGTGPATPAGSPSPGRTLQPESSTPDAGPSQGRFSDWELGASPLPLRPDEYGQVQPTPRELRNRRFPTTDLLPPPPGGRWTSSIGPITPEIRRRMGKTWSRRCPVTLAELRYVTVAFRGFDGEAHTGEFVVAASEAADVVSVFRSLFEADFPIEEMRLVTSGDLDAHPTGDGNNTAGLVCRPSTGQTQWSAHAYGLAIDLNPFQNPYENADLVLPELATSYLDRRWTRPGMIRAGGLVRREFARIGWSWGGDWSSLKDYQHFSALHR